MPSPLIGFGLSRKQSLSHHLEFNHYPPIDQRWLPICEAAIDLAVNAAEPASYGDNDGGIFFADESVLDAQVGQGKTAAEVIEGLHLWDFVIAAVYADEYHDEPKAGE